MDKARKNDAIHAAADRMAANYKSSQIPMYGDALRMPSRNAVIEILRDCQKLIFPVYYGDGDLLKLPPEQCAFDGTHPRKTLSPDRADDAGMRGKRRPCL